MFDRLFVMKAEATPGPLYNRQRWPLLSLLDLHWHFFIVIFVIWQINPISPDTPGITIIIPCIKPVLLALEHHRGATQRHHPRKPRDDLSIFSCSRRRVDGEVNR
jgi:hypothetical protein